MNTATGKPTTLSVSCVVYDTDYDILAATIESLHTAIQEAIKQKSVNDCSFYLINNHPATPDSFQQAVALAKSLFTNIEIINGHGNIGYGRANNLAIKHTQSDYHLILNPDVDLDSHSIFVGINVIKCHSCFRNIFIR